MCIGWFFYIHSPSTVLVIFQATFFFRFVAFLCHLGYTRVVAFESVVGQNNQFEDITLGFGKSWWEPFTVLGDSIDYIVEWWKSLVD